MRASRDYLWSIVDDGRALQNRCAGSGDIPAETTLSSAISKDAQGARLPLLGPTIVYAFMQAVGMVNDHLVGCLRHDACAALAAPAIRLTMQDDPQPRPSATASRGSPASGR